MTKLRATDFIVVPEWAKGEDMETISWKRGVAAVLGTGLMLANAVCAAQESVVAEVTFVDPIQITEDNALQYGLLDVGLADTETVVIAPDGSVTDAGGNVLGGTQAAAQLTVDATAGAGITILVDNISGNTGYDLTTFMCNYAGGTDTACDGGGYGATSVSSADLLIGATLEGDGNAGPGTFNGSFDVTVTYQ